MSPCIWINLAGTRDIEDTSVLSNEEDTVLQRESLEVLERTRDNVSAVGGQALRPVITRQIDARRLELEGRRGNKSVIVRGPSSSTPDPSLNFGNFHPPQLFFPSTEELQVAAPRSAQDTLPLPGQNLLEVPAGQTPFEIYQDTSSDIQQQQKRIVIVNTPDSIGQENHHPSDLLDSSAKMGDDEEAQKKALIKNFNKLGGKLKAVRVMYNPDKYDPKILKRNEAQWTSEVKEAYAAVLEAFYECEDYITDEERPAWDEMLNGIANEMTDYTLAYQTKVMTIEEDPPAAPHAVGGAVGGGGGAPRVPGQAARTAQINVDVDIEKITGDIKNLNKEIRRVADWTTADNHEVRTAMKKCEPWKKQFKSIRETFFDIKKNVMSHNLDDSRMRATEAAVETLGSELTLVTENIQFEDDSRCLFSLSGARGADVKYPTFGGGVDEDYFKFEKEMIDCFKKNHVLRDDQVKVLRDEALKDAALKCVPKSMKDIDTAWGALRSRFDDVTRMGNSKKSKLQSLGNFPKYASKAPTHMTMQVEWLHTLEILLGEIFELTTHSDDMYSEFFNPSLLREVKKLFPYAMLREMKISGSAKEQMEAIYSFLVTFREETQGLLKDLDDGGGDGDSKTKGNVASGGGGGGGFGLFGNSRAYRNEKCRVCVCYEQEGDTADLYEDHYGKSVFGCPRFAAASTKERSRLVFKTRLCRFCLDPNYVHKKKGDRHINCPAFSKPMIYNCKACRVHYLVCEEHVNQNAEKLEQSNKFWTSKGKMFSTVSVLSSPPRQMSQQPNMRHPPAAPASGGPPPPPARVPVVPMPGVSAVPPATSSAAQGEKFDDTLRSATEKLKQLAKGSKVIPVPEGEPLFLFSNVAGKTRPLNCFYDSGCSHIIWKTGVPVLELPAVMTQKGPLYIQAAGDVEVPVGDQFACLVDRTDGSKQVMVGVCLDKITTTFPLIKTGEAVKEIVKNVPANKKKLCSSLKIPEYVGGEVDILCGILYNSCHPEVLHTLESGLFIAKLKLASDKGFTACIGGPHRSFTALSQHTGDVSRLMAHFVDGLKSYRKLGAPKLPAPLMSSEDIQFAMKMNAAEVASVTGVYNDDVDDDVPGDDEANDDEAVPSWTYSVSCGGCGVDTAEDPKEILDEIRAVIGPAKMDAIAASAIENETDERLYDLKTMIKCQEQGLVLEYRCPTCRQCQSCRNAPDTERISLREELEDEAIKNSVNIDYEENKITCKLPLRGDPNKFLSGNREIAKKVLEGQCRKVQNDPEGRAAVIKSFHKLLDNGYAVKFDDLTEEQRKNMLAQGVQHYLAWRVVYKLSSVQTPVRTVMDASSKTPALEDGTGGHCLNNLAMKGRINTLDLITMLLRFIVGPVAVAGDLRQFYTSMGLHSDQWNLQRVLWKDEMNLDSETIELVIISLIFGVRSVSALSERAVLNLADHIRPSHPRLAEMLVSSRFVDDLADSAQNHDELKKLIDGADKLFQQVGLKCKGWTMSGSPPHPECTLDNISLEIGGMIWWPQLDTLQIKIPPLHFGKKSRGKLTVGTEVFDGSFEDLQKFVPQNLTRRQIVSKFASIFDPIGKLLPVTAAMKKYVRDAVNETTEWDGHVTEETRAMWIKNFFRIHQMKGIQFQRARIPIDAENTNMELIAAADAANDLKICGVWARFKRKNGKYSSQLIIGRSLLAKENSTIPKEELEAATICSNLLWVVRKALEGWVTDYILISDSVITLCWITSEKKRLSLYHRNRVIQVRLNTDVEKLMFVRTTHNPADVGTRSEKVNDDSVGPQSVWERGCPWMEDSIEAAVKMDILKPAAQLRMVDTEEDDYNEGFIYEKTPEILIRGHAVSADRVSKMEERAKFSGYIFMPTRFPFKKVVVITALVFKFIRKCKYARLKRIEERSFKTYSATFAGLCWGSEAAHKPPEVHDKRIPTCDPVDVARALNYWYSKATLEVEKFNKPETVNKIGVKKENILYCRSRIQDGQRFVETAEFGATSLGLEAGLHLMTPLIDRHSPIAYSIGLYIHDSVGKHAGFETCYRLSLEYVHIIQGASLFKIIGDECSKCAKIRKKYLEVAMGPISKHQLSLCPLFHVAYCDLDGPYTTYVPGYERTTRNRKTLSAKCYIMTFCDPISKSVNLQVLESKCAEAILEGVCRLGCEVGYPKHLVMDQDSSFLKMTKDAEVNLLDLNLRCYTEIGVSFEVAPVGGHNHNGLTERKIRSVQECFQRMDLDKVRLHATGLQTMAKLVENQLNNLPMGYSYGRDSNNTPLLKLITPNMMKIGRLNSRSLAGPLKFPAGPKDFLKKVQDTYEAFYRIWNVTMIPKLLSQPKWYKDGEEIKLNDIVYFKKQHYNELSEEWTLGQVYTLVKSKDGVVRRVTVRYHNAPPSVVPTGGDPLALGPPMFTDRAVRSLCKLFNVEDSYWVDDMSEVEKLVKRLEENNGDVENTVNEDTVVANDVSGGAEAEPSQEQDSEASTVVECQQCCCRAHCGYLHVTTGKSVPLSSFSQNAGVSATVLYPDTDTFEEGIDVSVLPSDVDDEVYRILTSLETQFDLD